MTIHQDAELSQVNDDNQGAGPPATLSTAAYTIVTESSDAMLVVDEAGIVQFANPAATALFGREVDELVGNSLGLPLPVNPGDLEILRPEGSLRIAEVSTRPISWSGAPAVLASLRDVTDRRRAEMMLLQSQQVLRAALDTLTAGVIILDTDGTIIAANRAWQSFVQQTHISLDQQLTLGSNFLRACIEALPFHMTMPSLAEGVLDVLRGRQKEYLAEYMIEGAAGARWFHIHITSCGSGWARAVVAHEEITGKKQQELLETDKRHILELVARRHSLETIMGRLLGMAADRYPDLIYAALELRSLGAFRSLARGPAEHQAAAYDQWATTVGSSAALAVGAPAIYVSRPADPAENDRPRPPMAFAVCWQTHLYTGSESSYGLLILCRGADTVPNEGDLVFVELVGQLMTIAVEQHEHTRQLAHQAHHDALTGLPNRLLFEDRLLQALQRARRSGRTLAVLFIDLDRFKQVNDSYGHAVGDRLLIQVARRFEGCVRASDTLARRGGDEFMLVLPEVASSQHVAQVARRLHDMLAMPFVIDGNELFVGASIGASVYPGDGEDADTLQRNADAAMYRAKKGRHNSFQFFDAGTNQAALERLQLEAALRQALEREELSIHFQPKVNRHGRLAGAEALLRWRHPTLGPIPPSRFIPLAEELGLIVPIGEWCLDEICRQARLWQRRGVTPMRLAANISTLQFVQPGFLPAVTRALALSGIDPAWLELELTEGMLMGNVEAITRQLGELRDLQLTLAIDDFGTGFSSLAYLQRLPISVLKIDRSFVGRLGRSGDADDRGIVSAIVTLGHHLGKKIVAEGVETEAQHMFLQSIGCDLFQGYLFSEPLPTPLFEHLMGGGTVPGALWRA